MASKSFAINTEPHVATIGNDQLLFEPEVIGAEFAEAYAALREVQAQVKKQGDDIESDTLLNINKAMREFVARFMLPDSATKFETLRLPDRILVGLLEWVAELYGGGSGNAPGGQSSESS
jgi:hypothetical protein